MLACRTARLLVADSSISVRIACRSSVAEITGNSNTSTHPSASRNCNEVTRRAERAARSGQHVGGGCLGQRADPQRPQRSLAALVALRSP